MKKRFQKENFSKNLDIITHRSERSSSSNILSEVSLNKNLTQLLMKKPIRCSRFVSQDNQINEQDTKQQETLQYKKKKIDQLKIQLQNLKQNYDKQSRQQYNIQRIIDNTISQLIDYKNRMNFEKPDEPWQEIVKMEKDIQVNEDNIMKQMPLNHFNEILLGHQLNILELSYSQQKISQRNYWLSELNLLHEIFLQRNSAICQILQPSWDNLLEQSIELTNEEIITQSFGRRT